MTRALVELVADQRFYHITRDLLCAAKSEIFLSTYKLELTDTPKSKKVKELVHCLEIARQRGCVVKVLLNYTEPKLKICGLNKRASILLEGLGIEVKHLEAPRTVHAKLLIVDGVVALIGSHNWSARSMDSNFELSLLVREAGLVKDLIGRYLTLFGSGKGF